MKRCLLVVLVLVACSSTSTPLAQRCDITLQAPEPAAGVPGTLVTVRGSPLTADYDTALYLGGLPVPLESLDRSSCEADQADGSAGCDECRAAADCLACGDCDDCDQVCATTCVESFTFTVPEAPAGATTLWILNAHGQSNTVPFEVQAAPVAGDTADSG